MRKNITTLAEQIEVCVPKLSFTAYYDADDPKLNASMRLYKKRAFVYVLAIDFHESEEYIMRVNPRPSMLGCSSIL